jgi:hypothetical protein
MKIPNESTKLEYSAPEVRSVSEAEILEIMGPAQAYTGTVPFGF